MSKKPGALVLVNVKFPSDLLEKIDSRSKMKGDRSQFIRDACLEKLERAEAEEAPIPA